jgi:MFS family permease
MAAGSLFLAPTADRWGRRPVVLTSVAMVSLGMLSSAFAGDLPQLALLRVFTGIGIGGILASATVLVAEYSPARVRSAASCLYTAGYSLGATTGGAIAAGLIAHHGWRSAFLLGAAMSVVMLPATYWGLPESRDFLLTRRSGGSTGRLNALLRRLRVQEVGMLLPSDFHPVRGKPSVRHLFSAPFARSTVSIWTAFFAVMAAYYFVFGWTPRLLAASGLTAQQGITGGVLLSLGGIIGTVLFAFASTLVEIRKLTCLCLLAAAALMGLFAFVLTNLSVALLVGVLLGGTATSAMAGLYALTPTLYEPGVRTTGMGWALGVGRIGAILAPMATGALVDHGWQPAQLYLAFIAPFVVSLLALAALMSPVSVK